MKTCQTPGCEKEAKLQCPTCLKLGLDNFFCNQDCFKGSWVEHKKVHQKTKSALETVNRVLEQTNPWPNYKFTGPLRPVYPLSKKRLVPAHIARPDYADHPEGFPAGEREAKMARCMKVLNDEEIEAMRVVGRISREILDEGAAAVAVGVTTDELDRIVHEATVERESYPSPLNYHKFPKSCCTSVNECICHGIPDNRKLEDGDLVNIDVTAYHRGFHGDLNETLFVGNVDEQSKKLVQVAHECLYKSIDIVKPGEKYREVGNVITKHASANSFSVVRTYCGHGINDLFHTSPTVPHYAKNKAVGIMKPGHTFTIEPMISAGSFRDATWPDDWTSVTIDGKRSAQFEQTLLCTENGVEILTERRSKGGQPYFMD
ncbi:methionine aminopeptidase 1-like [Watersipora subatra]|uniref:methionine aminopeptidase 1-like n=1 Tax=Watersipora subatra TaxID=2589382 RepID=UPI00355C745B